MNKEHPEYKRVREEIARIVKDCRHQPIIAEWDEALEITRQILSIKGLEIADGDQSLPDNLMFNTSTLVEMRAHMLKSNFKKVI